MVEILLLFILDFVSSGNVSVGSRETSTPYHSMVTYMSILSDKET
jgi:hypothetical protein